MEYTPEIFKQKILSKYPDGVSSDGRKYSDIPAYELTQKVVEKYPDGVDSTGVKYSDYLKEEKHPSFVGGMIRGTIKPFARLGASLAGMGSELTGNTDIAKKIGTEGINSKYLGNIKPYGDKTIKASYEGSPTTVKDFTADALGAIGGGLDIGSNFATAGAGSAAIGTGKQAAKQALKLTTKQLLKKSVPVALEGAVSGAMQGMGSSLQESPNIPQALGQGAIGAGIGGVLGGTADVVGAKIGQKFNKGLKLSNKIDKLDSNARELTEGVVADNKVREENIKAFKREITRLEKESPNINIVDDTGKTRPLNIKKDSPNEIWTGVNELQRMKAANARAGATEASSIGAKVDNKFINDAIDNIAKAIDVEDIKKGKGASFVEQLQKVQNDPLELHDFIQKYNKELERAYDKGKVPEYLDNALQNLRSGMDTVVDRKTYGESFGDGVAFKRMVLQSLKKANKNIKLGDVFNMHETALDAAFSTITGNPAFMARGLAEGIFRGVYKNYQNGKGLRLIRNAAKLSKDIPNDIRMPSDKSKIRGLLGSGKNYVRNQSTKDTTQVTKSKINKGISKSMTKKKLPVKPPKLKK